MTSLTVPVALGIGAIFVYALYVLLSSFDRATRRALAWGAPPVAVLPLVALLVASWRPTPAELDLLTRLAAVLYGPLLVSVAALVFGLSRPFPKHAFARHPLFWVGLPNVIAGIALAALLLLGVPARALTPGADTTVTKALTAQFDATGRALSGATTTGDQIALAAATPSATTPLVAGSAIPTAGAGAGAHTLQGPGTVFLLVRGNGLATTAYYDGVSNAFSTATAGPAIPTAVGAGGLSIPRGSGTFLLVVGGSSKNVHLIDPGTGGIGSWTVTTPAFTLAGATGAGAGAHAIKRTDGRFVIVHGAGLAGGPSPLTTLYTPPGTYSTAATTSVTAGTPTAVTPTAMGSIRTGDLLTVDTGTSAETVTVSATTATTFTATFTKAHGTASYPIVIAESAVAGPTMAYASNVFTTSSTTTVAAGAGKIVTPAAMSGITTGDRLVVDSGAAQETITVSATTASTFTATFVKAHGPASWPISTSSVTAVTAGAGKVVTPRSMTGIVVGSVLVVDTGAAQESVTVTAVTATTFTATFANGHGAASWPIVLATAVGDGALSIPLTGANAGKWTTFLGGGKTTAAVYDPASNTFSTTGVTVAPTALGAGATAIQYADGTLSGAARWVILNGASTKTYFKYDPAGALGQALASLTNAGNPTFAAGTHAFKRGDGSFLVVSGASTTTRVWAPGTATFSANGPALTVAPGVGAHTFQQTDGQMMIVLANSTTTNLHDAGWTGTYTSEMINPNIVDFWDQLAWVTSGPLPQANSVKISVRTGTDTTLPTPAGATTYQDFLPTGSGTGAGVGAITSTTAPQGKRFIQVRVMIARPSAASPDAETGVWLGSGSLAYDRAAAATTSSLAVSTSSSTAVSTATATVTPASMAGVVVGSVLLVDTGAAQETVTVSAVTATTFTAAFAKTHSGTWTITTAPITAGAATVTPASMAGIVVGSILAIDSGTALETVTVTGVTATTFTATFTNGHVGSAAWPISGGAVLRNYSLRFKRALFYPSLGTTTPTAGVAFSAGLTLMDTASPTQNAIAEYAGAHTIFFSGANAAPDGTAPIITAGGAIPFGGNTAVTFTAGATPAGATLTLYDAVPPTSSTSTVAAGVATATPAQMDGIITGNSLVVDTGAAQESVTITGTTATTFTATFTKPHGPASWTIAQQPQSLAGNENSTSTSTSFYLCAGATACGASGPITVVSVPVAVTVGAGAISAANSDTFATPSTVAVPGSSTITTNVRDSYKNPINGVIVSYSSSRGAADTISPPPGGTGGNGQLNGQQQATDTSSTIGTATISVTAGGVGLKSVTISFTSPPGQAANVTLTKDSQTFLNATGITATNTVVSGGNVQLTASNAAAAAFCSTPLPCGAAAPVANGPGAHTLQGSGGQYLTLNGGGANSGSLYDGKTGYTGQRTFRDLNNVAFNLGAGAHSVLLPAGGHSGQFLTVLGGGSGQTMYVDPGLGQAVAAGPLLSGGGTAGAGAFAVAISGNRFLLVHGGGSTATSIYQTSTDTVVAGPVLTAVAGAGAHALTLTDGTGRALIVHGGGLGSTTLFDPVTNATAAGAAIVAGTAASVGAGGHSAQLSATSWLIVTGGASSRTVKLDTTTLAYSAGTNLSGLAGAGAHTLQRADGKLVVVHGGGLTTTSVYTPGTDAVAGGPATSAAVGDGGHAFQQTDHRYVEVVGNAVTTTNLYDAGWVGTGTFATEYLTRADLDSWNKVAWTVAGTGKIQVQVEVANTDLGIGQNSATTTVASGSATITPTTMAGIVAGSRLIVDVGASQETITVSSVTASTFTAAFANTHGPSQWPISLSASTNAAAATATVTVGNVAGLSVGNRVLVDTGTPQETVTVTAVDPTNKTFTAVFTNAHTAPYPVLTVGTPAFATALDAFSAVNPSTLTTTSANKFARGVVLITRAVPLAAGAQQQVWLGSSNSVGTRSEVASATLSSLSLGYRTGLFTLTGPSATTAGIGITTTVTLKDLVGTTLGTYTGAHVLVFDGANTAPAGNVPTAAGTNFGTGVSLSFTSGATSAATVLYAAETPAIGASETVAAQSLATYRIALGYTVQPNRLSVTVSAADPSATWSTITASPASIPGDGVTASTLTVTAKDAFANLSPGSPTLRTVSLASSSAFDTITPTTGSVSTPQAIFTASLTSTKAGTSTITATISGGAAPISVSTTVTITVSTGQGADLKLTIVDGTGTPLSSISAGVSFAVKVEVFNTGTTNPNTTYCNGTGGRTCSLVWTSTAGNAPDGTVPALVANSTGVVISGAVLTTTVSFTFSCANAGGTICLTETALPTITLTTTQASNSQTATGTTAGFSVNAAAPNAARSFVLLSPSAAAVSGMSCGQLTAPCAPTQISVWARVVDQFRNAAAGKSVSLATSRGVDVLSGTCASCTDTYGYTTPFTLTASAAGASTLTATVGATTITTATATFFDASALRINNGTYFGTVTNGAASVIPLGIIATDALGKPFIAQAGTALTSPTVTWTATGAGAGSFAAAGCTGTSTNTTSAALIAADYSAASHTTCFSAASAGAITITPTATAGSVPAAYKLTVVSYFDLSSTTSPSGRTVNARLEWDGTSLGLRSWQTGP